MMILGIDTATPDGGVAVMSGANGGSGANGENETGWMEAHRFGTEIGRAALLLPAIDTLLSRHRITLADIEAIAVSVGPGSYTGVRVGLAAAKGLGLGTGIPIIPVSTLSAYAAVDPDCTGWIVPLICARQDEVYWALFEQTPHALTRLLPDTASSFEAALNDLDALNHDLRVVGSKLYTDRISDRLKKRCGFPHASASPSLAAGVAREGLRRLLAGERHPPEAILPVYLSPFPRMR